MKTSEMGGFAVPSADLRTGLKAPPREAIPQPRLGDLLFYLWVYVMRMRIPIATDAAIMNAMLGQNQSTRAANGAWNSTPSGL